MRPWRRITSAIAATSGGPSALASREVEAAWAEELGTEALARLRELLVQLNAVVDL